MKSLTALLISLVWVRLSSASETGLPPTVLTRNGTYEGTHIQGLHVDSFLGIPYAQAPVHNLRYSPPQGLNSTWTDVRKAKSRPNVCPQYPVDPSYAEDNITMSEDCLALNVFKPAGILNNLPVLVWFHGGGYYQGYSLGPGDDYNMSYLVHESVEMGKPIIGISVNYRLGFWGFLSSNEVLNTGNANLGLKDQRLALHWVQENIAAFGGDSAKVTIWGQSAGASSVGVHLIANGGNAEGLFRAGILQSGAATFDAWNGTDYYEPIYDQILEKVSCSAAYDTLSCLRAVSYSSLYDTLANVTDELNRSDYMPSIDGSFVREWPHISMLEGRSVNVPIMTGTVTDEGTDFTPTNVNTSAELYNYLLYHSGVDLKPWAVSRLLELYPDDPTLGSPYDEKNISTFPGFGREWKRTASIIGDYAITAHSRFNAQTSVMRGRNVWSYRFNILPTGNPLAYGVSHGTDIPFILHIPTASFTAEQNSTSQFMARSWISFVHDLDPRGTGLKGKPAWTPYNSQPQNMVFDEVCYLEKDEYRKDGIGFILDHLLLFAA